MSISAGDQQTPATTRQDAPGGNERPGGRKRRKPIDPESIPMRKLIPNLLTTGALCSGMAAVLYASQNEFGKAMTCVAISFVLDALDGRAARFLRVTSRFGEVVDSIADFTAFGVAPAFILYHWQLGKPEHSLGVVGLVIAVMFTLCAAIRLARFTIQARKQKLGGPVGKFFQGCPAPAAGSAVLIPPMLALSDLQYTLPVWGTAAFTVFLALFMVSRVPMISIKGLRISRKLVVPLMLVAGAIVLGLLRDPWLTMSSLCMLYLLSFPLGVVLYRRRKSVEAPIAAPTGSPDAPTNP